MCNCDVHPGPSCEVRANRKGGFQPHTSESLITRRGSCKRELRSHSPKLARLPATALLNHVTPMRNLSCYLRSSAVSLTVGAFLQQIN